jgi:hypothetical protein
VLEGAEVLGSALTPLGEIFDAGTGEINKIYFKKNAKQIFILIITFFSFIKRYTSLKVVELYLIM